MEKYSEVHSSKWQSKYSEEFKRHVCNDFLTGSLLRRQIERKYKLGNSRLNCWLKELGYRIKDPVPLYLPTMAKPSKGKQNKDVSVARLKRELEDAQLQAEAYRRIIDKAEQELNISIRKKSNTK